MSLKTSELEHQASMLSAGLEFFPFLLHTADVSSCPHALHCTELDIVICAKALDCTF